MNRSNNQFSVQALSLSLLVILTAHAAPLFAEPELRSPPRTLTQSEADTAAKNYQQYCSLCHGDDRQGHANDHAPSLRSKSLMQSGIAHQVLRPMQYGRTGTAMGGYLDEVGGPMTLDETWNLTYWLFEQAGYDRLKFSTEPVAGDIAKGEQSYQQNCSSCHGAEGQGVNAPALMNPSALAHNTDEFIRYAIEEGRQDTPMQAFKEVLPADEINNITAFIRSKSIDWQDSTPVLKELPKPADYVINKEGDNPTFELKDDKFVYSKDLDAALRNKNRMVLLDTRVQSVWQTAHIEGAVPFPYYSNLSDKVEGIPKDVFIVAYCSCPRAAAEHTIKKLNDIGYNNTAVLWEGIFGWMHLGYPVSAQQH